MGLFNATLKAYAQGKKVKAGILIELRFTEPAYFWNGQRIITVAGHAWHGLGYISKIEGLEEALNGESIEGRVGISSAKLDRAIITLAASEDRANYVDSLIVFWLQFFEEEANNWATLDDPVAIKGGLIKNLELSSRRGPGRDRIRTLDVIFEDITYGRRIAPFGFFTDSDQRARYPDDPATGLEFIPQLQDKTIAVPW